MGEEDGCIFFHKRFPCILFEYAILMHHRIIHTTKGKMYG